MKFEVFLSLGWVLFYLAAVVAFSTHMCLGWQKVAPASGMDIPELHRTKAIHIGCIMAILIVVIYAMFLLVFIIIHAVGNLHVFLGPDDFNGYGCFYATSTGSVSASTRTSSRSTSCLRLYCTPWWR